MGYEARLIDGAKGSTAQRILGMFTEDKRISSNEQHMDEDENVQLVSV